MNTLAERLKFARHSRGISQVALAKQLGCGQSSIASIESGRNRGSALLIPIAEALRVSPSWLATGKGAMEVSPASGETNSLPYSVSGGQIFVWEKPEDLPEDDERVWIDRFDLECSAGDGISQWEVRQKQALPFTKDFFRSVGAKPEDCRLVTTRGDSMEPYLFDKDMIMIDTSRTSPRDGNVYAVCFEEEFLVKQVFKQAGGALTLHSYNPKYPDRTVPANEHTRFEILGQVIYRSGSGLPSL